MSRDSGRITIKDIAKYCGLSIGAVSSVLQNKQEERRLPEKTVKKVYNAVKKLGYIPDIGARRLRAARGAKAPLSIALLTTYEAPLNAISNFLFELRNVVDTTPSLNEKFDVSISLELFKAGHLAEKKSVLSGNSFNAAVIANTTAEDDEFLSRAFLPYPNVLSGRVIDGYFGVSEQGVHGKILSDLLKKSGKKKPAVLYGVPLTQLTRGRVESFVGEAGGDVVRIKASNLSEAAGYNAVCEYLAGKNRFDFLFCVTDSFAMGAYRAIREFKLRIPEDISVVSVGDYSYADYFWPSLTTVGTLNKDFAQQGSLLLVKQLMREITEPIVVETPVKTVIRDSL